jgi:hypothetical protein
MISLGLYTLAAFGTLLIALKYGLSDAPLPYHRAIIEKNGVVLVGTQKVIAALYRVWAATLAGFGICLLGLIWGPAADGDAWAHRVVLIAVLTVALPSTFVPRRVELATSVRTPWRLGAVLSGTVILGFLAWIAGY